jgi:hypothetical protein
MSSGIDEMIDEVMWVERCGIWFSGPYRIVLSHIQGDYCLWYYDKTSKMLKRGFNSLAWAKRTAEDHRELMKIKIMEKPLAT